MIWFWIYKDIIAAGQVQCEQAMIFRRFYTQCLTIELILLRNVRRRESAECFTVFQHDEYPF